MVWIYAANNIIVKFRLEIKVIFVNFYTMDQISSTLIVVVNLSNNDCKTQL